MAARVVVLGTAQDGGVPQMGCRDACCCGGAVQPRLVSSLALLTGDGAFLFDATPDVRAQAKLLSSQVGVQLHPRNLVHGIFITHAHVGHYAGLLQFGKEGLCASLLPVYCSARFADFMRANEPFRSLVTDERIVLNVVAPGESVEVSSGVSVRAVAVKHRSELSDTLAFVIRNTNIGGRALLYCPDADDWTWPIDDALRGVDIALLDGTFFSGSELPGRDMTAIPHPLITESIVRLRPLADTSAIYFTHFNHTNAVLRNEELIDHPFHRLEEGRSFDLS